MTYDTYLCRALEVYSRSKNDYLPESAAFLLEDGIKLEWSAYQTRGHIGEFHINEPGCRTLILELSCPEGTCDADVYVDITLGTRRELTLPARRHLRSE
jgi:hypothetical protein